MHNKFFDVQPPLQHLVFKTVIIIILHESIHHLNIPAYPGRLGLSWAYSCYCGQYGFGHGV